jgi:hypothetical protein
MNKKKTEDACPWVLVLILLPFAFMGFCFGLNAIFSFVDKVNTTAVEVQELKHERERTVTAYWEPSLVEEIDRSAHGHSS